MSLASGLSFLNSPTFSSSHKIKLGTTPTLSTSHIVHQTNQRTGKRVVDLNEVLTAQQFTTLIEKSTTVAYYLKIFQLITRRKLPKVTTLLTFGTSSLCNRGSLLSGGRGGASPRSATNHYCALKNISLLTPFQNYLSL